MINIAPYQSIYEFFFIKFIIIIIIVPYRIVTGKSGFEDLSVIATIPTDKLTRIAYAFTTLKNVKSACPCLAPNFSPEK